MQIKTKTSLKVINVQVGKEVQQIVTDRNVYRARQLVSEMWLKSVDNPVRASASCTPAKGCFIKSYLKIKPLPWECCWAVWKENRHLTRKMCQMTPLVGLCWSYNKNRGRWESDLLVFLEYSLPASLSFPLSPITDEIIIPDDWRPYRLRQKTSEGHIDADSKECLGSVCVSVCVIGILWHVKFWQPSETLQMK